MTFVVSNVPILAIDLTDIPLGLVSRVFFPKRIGFKGKQVGKQIVREIKKLGRWMNYNHSCGWELEGWGNRRCHPGYWHVFASSLSLSTRKLWYKACRSFTQHKVRQATHPAQKNTCFGRRRFAFLRVNARVLNYWSVENWK